MNYDKRFENVTVLGAAGKMGSGILLLTSMEMYDLSKKPENKDNHYVLYALDISQKALSGLMMYIQEQLVKQAERKINALRAIYKVTQDLLGLFAGRLDQNQRAVMQNLRKRVPTDIDFLAANVQTFVEAAKKRPELGSVSTTFRPTVPQLFVFGSLNRRSLAMMLRSSSVSCGALRM